MLQIPNEFLYRQNEFLLMAVLLALQLIATEVGFRRGYAVRSRIDRNVQSHHSVLQTGVLGLLALLLAFTFSMSATRYDIRRSLLIEEANALRTTYLRSRLLAEPLQDKISRVMRVYLDARLEYYDAGLSEEKLERASPKLLSARNQ